MNDEQQRALRCIAQCIHRQAARPEIPHEDKIEMLDSLRIIKETLGVIEPEGEPT